MFLHVNTKDGSQIIKSKYPRKDISEKIEGLVGLEIYKLVDNKPIYEALSHKVVKTDIVLSEDIYGENKHLKIAYQNWELIKLSDNQIISNLNISLGNHLDTQYPIWERTKHAGFGSYYLESKMNNSITPEEEEERQKIDAMYNWITTQRNERDDRENELVTNGTIPSFVWGERPN